MGKIGVRVRQIINNDNVVSRVGIRFWKNELINSLTAMGAHERPLFIELCGTVVSHRIFIRSQSLIAR
jgi:hypothetical protein